MNISRLLPYIGQINITLSDELSINNSKLGDYVDSIYPIELEMFASYLGLHHAFDKIGWVKKEAQ